MKRLHNIIAGAAALGADRCILQQGFVIVRQDPLPAALQLQILGPDGCNGLGRVLPFSEAGRHNLGHRRPQLSVDLDKLGEFFISCLQPGRCLCLVVRFCLGQTRPGPLDDRRGICHMPLPPSPGHSRLSSWTRRAMAALAMGLTAGAAWPGRPFGARSAASIPETVCRFF